ncbi:TonB family protein [Ereboglobus sp. PH5-10]|uniref:energy transducer TonB n=1 Tax=Ereboglobus sp. PH5-10 TaxID=2940629 RepID=UPI0024057162|nr:energy transducer TonB [Ereboglobus sp. PH5-10]MDF9827832.1 TonB family protein [Ereboglobus sp. PH5-10]
MLLSNWKKNIFSFMFIFLGEWSGLLRRGDGVFASRDHALDASHAERMNARFRLLTWCWKRVPERCKWAVVAFRQFSATTVIGAWFAQYAFSMLITAALLAALFLMPATPTRDAGIAGGGAETDAENAFVLVDASSMSAARAGGGSVGGETTNAPTDEDLPALTRDELAAVASEFASEELTQSRLDAFAWIEACGQISAAGGDGAFGTAGLHGASLAGGPGGFDAGGFSFAGFESGKFGGSKSGRLGGAVTFMPEPLYPELARREGREGVVELAVVVDASGRARSVDVERSSGHADLDDIARSTVLRQWRFQRATTGANRECVVQVSFDLRRSRGRG